jgi:cytochrome c peroxidase
MTRLAIAMIVAALAVLTGPTPSAAEPDNYVTELKNKYQRPTSIPFPADNAYTQDRETLGRLLFFDPRLSRSSITSCGSCHNASFAWGDGLPKGVGHGHKEVGRRTPTILNLAWTELLFWDGRAESLEEQALGPIAAAGEMNMPLEDLIPKVAAIEGYRRLFAMAYPGEGLTAKTLAKAIATFERTVVSGLAPFDDWVAGKKEAISESAKRGFVLFNGKARCAACHSGWNFTDGGFHDIGLPSADPGRGEFLPKITRMQHAFKTPTLRNVDQRAPYMHDGSVATLRDVIDLYDTAGVARPSRSPEIVPLGLTAAEKTDLLAFLRILTSQDPPVALPMLPR